MAFIVSKPTFDVDDTDPRNLIFHSEYNHLKTAIAGDFQKVFSGSGYATSSQIIGHSLGYHPLVLSYFKKTTEDKLFIVGADIASYFNRQGAPGNVTMKVTTTQVFFDIQKYSGGAGTIEVFYEIFYEGTA